MAALAGLWAAAKPFIAGMAGNFLNSAASNLGASLGGMAGQWGTSGHNSGGQQSSSEGGSLSQSGTNDQYNQAQREEQYQQQQGFLQAQGNYNFKSMLTAMGYNTLGAITQGIYNSTNVKKDRAAIQLRTSRKANGFRGTHEQYSLPASYGRYA